MERSQHLRRIASKFEEDLLLSGTRSDDVERRHADLPERPVEKALAS
jgi:hypothetical protein